MNNQYGGQAVIEGVLMRGRKHLAIAVRKPDGKIVRTTEKLTSLTEKHPIIGWPFIRGVFVLIETLILGMKALNYSANQALGEEEELTPWQIFLTMLTGFALAVLLFVAFPAGMTRLVQESFQSTLVLNLFEGLVKVAALLGYIIFISFFKDIRRIFEYHGAEHKVLYTFEAGEKLTVENARKFSTLHPRCGTNFLFIVIILSIIFFSFFGRPPLLLRILYHILLIPVVAGTAYEVIKFIGDKNRSVVCRAIAYPGLLLQKLTTREPSEEQLEVAIEALQGILEKEVNSKFLNRTSKE